VYHPTIGAWMTNDPTGYTDGNNRRAAYHVMHGGVDPTGLKKICFHKEASGVSI
jgi:hypothetical protein